MADRAKLSTCPICGYTDTADDADALQMAIEEHIRMSHNLDPATLGGTAGLVKPVTGAEAAQAGGVNYDTGAVPIIAAVPNSGGSGTAAPTAPAAVYAADVMANDSTLNPPGARDNNDEHRNDETSRF